MSEFKVKYGNIEDYCSKSDKTRKPDTEMYKVVKDYFDKQLKEWMSSCRQKENKVK